MLKNNDSNKQGDLLQMKMKEAMNLQQNKEDNGTPVDKNEKEEKIQAEEDNKPKVFSEKERSEKDRFRMAQIRLQHLQDKVGGPGARSNDNPATLPELTGAFSKPTGLMKNEAGTKADTEPTEAVQSSKDDNTNNKSEQASEQQSIEKNQPK